MPEDPVKMKRITLTFPEEMEDDFVQNLNLFIEDFYGDEKEKIKVSEPEDAA